MARLEDHHARGVIRGPLRLRQNSSSLLREGSSMPKGERFFGLVPLTSPGSHTRIFHEKQPIR
jgi:hypothetical protein